MLTVDNKQYRNLQEQVRFNQENIEYLLTEGGTLNEFGIKVVGQVNTYAQLPPAASYTGEYGDAYAVGTTTPYTFYIFTRATAGQVGPSWFNLGQFPVPSTVPGPTGATGPQGPTGVRGSIWVSGNGAPPSIGTYQAYDKYINTANGDVYTYNGTQKLWTLSGNIRGPQGPQGNNGQPGPAGAAGPVGPQGPKGDAGQSFTIAGTVASIDLLPTPTEENRTKGYLVGTDTYDLYVVVGTDTLTWKNLGRVEGVEGPQGPAGPQGIQGPNGYPIYSIDYQDEGFLEGQQRFDLTLSEFSPQDPAPVTNCIGVTKDGKMCTIGVQSDSEGYFITCYKSLIGPVGPTGDSATGTQIISNGTALTEADLTNYINWFNGIWPSSGNEIELGNGMTTWQIDVSGTNLKGEWTEGITGLYNAPIGDGPNIVRKSDPISSDKDFFYFDLSDTYKQNHMTRSEITELINNIKTTSFKVVDALPETGEGNIIYLVPRTSTEEQNIYDEYIWTGTAWEKISGSGGTAIDLSQYVKKSGDTMTGALTFEGQYNVAKV